MKFRLVIILSFLAFITMNSTSCESSTDSKVEKQTEQYMEEANNKLGLPAITNFQEKKNLKWIYELCDKEELICYAYFFNERDGSIGDFIGKCVGYGIPYSTQYSNPERRLYSSSGGTIPQPEPNGLFKPEGLSATWLILLDPATNQPRPVYIEPQIIVSPFKLK